MVNEIPLSLFIVMNIFSLGFVIFSVLYNESIVRILAAFIGTVLSYVNSMVLLGGNVVMVQTDGVTYSYIPIINTTYAYFWQFIAVIAGFFLLLFLADAINTATQPELEEDEYIDV